MRTIRLFYDKSATLIGLDSQAAAKTAAAFLVLNFLQEFEKDQAFFLR